jgi:hypothetical protein
MSLMPRREPWNKGTLVGQKPPLRPNACLADPYPIAIDSKPRGCDVVAPRVENVAPLHRGKGEYFDKPPSVWRKARGIWHIRRGLSAYLWVVNIVSRQTR